ncbi:MAG: hypothetical protein ACPK7O_05855 [Methanobacterium sp.]
MISAIITAVEYDAPINKELIAREGKIKNRLLLNFPWVPLIRDTVYSVLDAGVDECILFWVILRIKLKSQFWKK